MSQSASSKKNNDEKISMLQNVNIISPINTTENVNSKEYDCKKKINFNEQAEVHDDGDDDDGFFIPETNKNMNQSTLNADAENSLTDSLENDIFMQQITNGTIVRAVPDIKLLGQLAYPRRVYVVVTKASVWLCFCLMYRNVDKSPSSDSFWQLKIKRSENEEDMKKAFKFHLICDLRSKTSALIPKPTGRLYGGAWKAIIMLQKIDHQINNDKIVCQWGRDIAYFIDELLSDAQYYTPYRFAGNLTPQEVKPLSYHLTITEIFKILKLRYPFLSSEGVLNMLKENNLVSNYFDDTSFEEATNYVNNKGGNPHNENMSHSTINNSDNGHNVSMIKGKLMKSLMKH